MEVTKDAAHLDALVVRVIRRQPKGRQTPRCVQVDRNLLPGPSRGRRYLTLAGLAGNPDDARKALQTLAAEPQMLTTDALRALHCGAEAEVALHGGNPKAGSAKAAPRGTPLARGRLARGRGRNAHAPRRMHDEKR